MSSELHVISAELLQQLIAVRETSLCHVFSLL